MKDFPFIIGRKGGCEIDIMSLFITPQINDSFLKLLNIDNKLRSKKKLLLEILHTEIRQNGETNKKLLNFKRDVYNNRSLIKYKDVQGYLNNKIEKLLNDIETFKRKRNIEIEKYNLEFEIALKTSIKNLNLVTHKPFFKNGLLFASHILYNEINKTDFNFESLNKKNKKLIVSTLKYLTRSIVKTTPFSSFNNIFILEQNEGRSFNSKKENLQSYYQINNLFYYYLKEALLGIDDFKKELNLTTNTTIWEELTKNEFHFFINKDNNEAFKKLKNSPIIGFIKKELKQKAITYAQLILTLTNETSENPETVKTYVDSLINEGFIVLNFPTTQHQKKWMSHLKQYLQKKPLNTKFQLLISLIESIAVSIEKLNFLTIEERKDEIYNCYKKITDILLSINQSSQFSKKVKPQDLFYEDTFQSIKDSISYPKYNKICTSLKEAYSALNNISYKESLKAELSKIVISNHNGKLSLLKFYETIFLKNSIISAFSKVDLTNVEQIICCVKKIKEQKKKLQFIDLKEFITPSKNTYPISFGAYIQTTDNNFSQIILNGFSNGFGSNSSRFFNMCSEKQISKIKKFNRSNKSIIVDVKDASLHNTNIYPALTDGVISICNDNNLKNDYNLIDVSNLYVVANKEKGVILTNSKEEEIIPIQFSLEELNRKSKFTQFLDIFNINENFGYVLIIKEINNLFKINLESSNNNVIEIPRLCFGDNIILQRKKWILKKPELTAVIFSKELSLAAMFYKLNKWKTDNNIPDEVFIKSTNQDSKNPQNDNYKPIYINFTMPIFIILLQNILKSSDLIIELSEVLPSSGNVVNNGRFVKEYALNNV